ncbi:MAG: T9SS type A sorting domain-containing protein [Fimbriimonadaceae bacterium]|nr:T9SS type A sorting domain-containing protein [Chitinophagales bacterium]
MMKNFTLSTSKKLAAYSAMAAAFSSLATQADAQIVYNDIDDVTITASEVDEVYSLDLNIDGEIDFVFRAGTAAGGSWTFASIFGMFSSLGAGNVNNQIIATMGSLVPYASALEEGYTINEGANFLANSTSSNYAVLASNYYGVIYGNFGDQGVKYIGLRFDISGAIHFGWIRVDVTTEPVSVTIMDYAFNTTPETSINTADTNVVAIEQLSEHLFNVYSAGDIFYITTNSQVPQETKVAVYNVNGQKVYEGDMTQSQLQIQLKNALEGIYNVQIISGNKMLNKQVFIVR